MGKGAQSVWCISSYSQTLSRPIIYALFSLVSGKKILQAPMVMSTIKQYSLESFSECTGISNVEKVE